MRTALAGFVIVCTAALATKAIANWPPDANRNLLVFHGKTHQSIPRILASGTGGAFVIWADHTDLLDLNVSAQAVGAGGHLEWRKPVPITRQPYQQMANALVSDNHGGFITAWLSAVRGYWEVWLQRVGADGRIYWPRPGVRVAERGFGSPAHQLIPDGGGGAIVVWTDVRADTVFHSETDIYAQRVNASGQTLWPDQGVPVCTAPSWQSLSSIAPDGAGGVIVLWRDRRNGIFDDFYAQRITGAGAAAWPADGILLADDPASGWDGGLLADGAGGAFAVWPGHLVPPGLVGQRLGPNGEFLWGETPVEVAGGANVPRYPQLVPDAAGGFIVAWTDFRGGYFYPGTYVQRVSGDGVPLWQEDGIPATTHTYGSDFPAMTEDGEGGAIVTWMDYRKQSDDIDIYAQRFLSDGSIAEGWLRDGVAISTAPRYQRYPVIARAPRGAIIAWPDGRESYSDDDIYAQRVSLDGRLGMPDESAAGAAGARRPPAPATLDVAVRPATAAIALTLAAPEHVLVTVHDAAGRLVAWLHEGALAEGRHEFTWDGRTIHSGTAGAGIYIARALGSSERVWSQRFVRLPGPLRR
jgi:hypothetical protein